MRLPYRSTITPITLPLILITLRLTVIIHFLSRYEYKCCIVHVHRPRVNFTIISLDRYAFAKLSFNQICFNISVSSLFLSPLNYNLFLLSSFSESYLSALYPQYGAQHQHCFHPIYHLYKYILIGLNSTAGILIGPDSTAGILIG